MHRRIPTLPALAIALPLLLAGCNYGVMIGYLVSGPPTIEPAYQTATKQDMTDLDVKVAVVCYAPKDLKFEHDSVDLNVARLTTTMLRKHHVDVVSADAVRAWIAQNPDWDKPEEIGDALGATHVVYIDLHTFGLYEEEARRELYRGRAEAYVSVFEMNDDGSADKTFTREVMSKYPYKIPRHSSEVSYKTFRTEYLVHLADKIGRLFYEHRAGDDISNAA